MENTKKFHHDGKGNIKDHDDEPVKSGESVYSENLWNKITGLEKLSTTDEKNKDVTVKTAKKENKLLSRLAISKDNRGKKEIVIDEPIIENPVVEELVAKKTKTAKKASL